MKRKLILLAIIFLAGVLSINAQQLPAAPIWNKCFGGTQHDVTRSIIPAFDGGYIVAGYSYSNDGDVWGHHGTTATSDAWIFKISANGILEWQRSLGGSADDQFKQVIATSDGNYLAVGDTYSNDGDVTGHHGQNDVWVVKLDRYGNLLWQKNVGGSQYDNASSVANTNDGGYVIVGASNSNDGDITKNQGSQDMLLFTLTSEGNLKSLFTYGGSNNDVADAVTVFPNGSIAIGGTTDSRNGDFPEVYTYYPLSKILVVNPAGQILQNATLQNRMSTVNGLIQKANGTLLAIEYHWRCYPGEGYGVTLSERRYSDLNEINTVGFEYCSGATEPMVGYAAGGNGSVVVLPNNHMIVVGSTDQPGVAPNSERGSYNEDAFIAKTNFDWPTSGTWKKGYGGSGLDRFLSIAAESEYAWAVAGSTSSNDGDVSGNHGGSDSWIVMFGNYNTIKGTVFLDDNRNGIKDANEPFVDNIMVRSEKGSQFSASSTQNGIFYNSVDTGTYSTSLMAPIPHYNSGVPKITNFNSFNNTDSISFALQPIPDQRDYLVDLFAVTPARPGFPVLYQMQYSNLGTDTLQNRVIKMVKDHRLQFNVAYPAQSSITADTITWIIPSLLPRTKAFIGIELTAAAPPDLNFDDTISTTASIDTTGDLEKANNFRLHQLIVTGAYDPNDKQEAGGGALHPAAINQGKYLTYTIRFQNTGTDTAFTVVIKDTLSDKTDLTSFEMIGASHPYLLTVKNGNIATWTFKNILLVDSNRNEPLSHGFVSYRIKPKNNLLLKDSIHNSASIYFDFNLPVMTNTQHTVVRVLPPPQPAITGVQAEYCSTTGSQKAIVSNLPASIDATTANAYLNNEVVPIAPDSTIAFNPSILPAGKNTLKVVFENPFGTQTLEQHFQVITAADPEVNISSSTSHITSLAVPVTITATNAAGGGTAPVFTFAKDREFISVLQQGTSPILNRNAADFTIGDNWIYVRMTTSETCFKTDKNTDSIKINRDVTTGISDPENPGQIILVYPNPFKGQFRIKGLNSAKLYTLVVSNAQGKQVLTKRMSGSDNSWISLAFKPKGLYLLSIYDEKKKQMMGTIPLVKE